MIPAEKTYTWINDRFMVRKSTNGWWMGDCPFCGKRRKLAFHFAWSYSKCWSCKWRDSIVDFVMKVEDVPYAVAYKMIMETEGGNIDPEMFVLARSLRTIEVELPFGYTPLIEGRDRTIGKRACSYLEGRGFDIEKLDRLGFGYVAEHAEDAMDNYFGYIIMPVRQDGRMRYFIARDFMGGFPKYKNPPKEVYGVGKDEVIFNADAFNMYKEVFLLEGIFDGLTLSKRAAATLGWSWSQEQVSWMVDSSCESVVIVSDKGFYGQAVQQAMKLMDHKVVRVVNLDHVEHGKDVNEIGRRAVMDIVSTTPVLTYEMACDVLGA